MSQRLLTVLEQLKTDPALDDATISSLKKRLVLQSLRAQFTLSPHRLRELAVYMKHEMHQGLKPLDQQIAQSGAPSTLAMLPSFVTAKDAEKFSGVIYAIDLGGSNYRVIRMVLERGKVVKTVSAKSNIPEEHIHGTSDGLFGCIAESVAKFMSERFPEDGKDGTRVPLGFTFSFPVEQKAIDAGHLIRWTKGFTTTGVVGNDVVSLLQQQLDKRSIPVKVVALCNDTVGTLITRFFSDDQCEIGCILGTGANACYWEARSNITKLPQQMAGEDVSKRSKVSHDDDQMVVNMEFGNFDSARLLVLPVTQIDQELDDDSPPDQKGGQRFEKMISGKYLGEIARRIMVKCSQQGYLPLCIAQQLASKPFEFESRDAGLLTSDRSPGAPLARAILLHKYGCDIQDGADMHFIQQICALVQQRSAQLAGMAIAAVLQKTGKQDNATVAVDGSVYFRTPGYARHLADAIGAVLGDARGVRIKFTSDGSGLGAGYIAALTQIKE